MISFKENVADEFNITLLVVLKIFCKFFTKLSFINLAFLLLSELFLEKLTPYSS